MARCDRGSLGVSRGGVEGWRSWSRWRGAIGDPSASAEVALSPDGIRVRVIGPSGRAVVRPVALRTAVTGRRLRDQ